MGDLEKSKVHAKDKKKLKEYETGRIRKESGGILNTPEAFIFDDSEYFGDSVEQSIVSIKVFSGKNKIFGLQTTYKLNNEVIEGSMNIQYSLIGKCDEDVLEIQDDDALKYISGIEIIIINI